VALTFGFCSWVTGRDSDRRRIVEYIGWADKKEVKAFFDQEREGGVGVEGFKNTDDILGKAVYVYPTRRDAVIGGEETVKVRVTVEEVKD